ncbi:MAG: carbon monoxide dehydrogenase subunit G [Alphaproteobacteria bacterium]|nr:carbon monoxide dehydrogenase subunit G [Alphaproteobacteria bacterium]
MDMTGEYRIAAPAQTVWDALNDPEILKQAIPGCQELNKVSDTEFNAKVKAKVGPVSAAFAGAVQLSNVNPPASYTISGEGKGGAAGFAKGSADVALAPDGDGTLLSYKVHAAVGGKLAQIGSRIVDGAARKMADEFFSNFKAALEPEAAPAAAATPAEAAIAAADEVKEKRRGVSPWVWVAAVIVLVILLLAAFGTGG